MTKCRMIAAAGLVTLLIAAPATAGSSGNGEHVWDHRHGRQSSRHAEAIRDNYRREQRLDRIDDRRDDRKNQRRAYAAGYRDGNRHDNFQVSATRNQIHHGRGTYGSPVFYSAGAQRTPSIQGGPYWVGSNGHINCRRDDGSTGVIVGALAGGTLGNILAQNGDKKVGSIIGGTIGALLGKELDRGNGTCR